jgi:DNA-directed RNA polymerase specialized sigma24 family protein
LKPLQAVLNSLRWNPKKLPANSVPPEFEADQWFKTEVLPHAESLRLWLLDRYPTLPDVDNLVQDCLVRVLHSRDRCPIRAPKSFLFAIARNLAVDQEGRIVSTEARGHLLEAEVRRLLGLAPMNENGK